MTSRTVTISEKKRVSAARSKRVYRVWTGSEISEYIPSRDTERLKERAKLVLKSHPKTKSA